MPRRVLLLAAVAVIVSERSSVAARELHARLEKQGQSENQMQAERLDRHEAEDQVETQESRAPESKEGRAKPFELHAAQRARQEKIEWERWHKRVCKAITHRTQDRALTLVKLLKLRIMTPSMKSGMTEMLITVTKDRKIKGQVIKANDLPKVTEAMQDAVASLDGDELLAFPPESQRQSITIDMVFEHGPKVLPGTRWVKNDTESVLVHEQD